MATPDTSSVPPKRRVKKRILIPSILLVLFVLFFIGSYVRGTWADSEPRNPQTTAEGTITHLLRTPEGQTHIRCAIVVEAAPEKVWALISDYGRHPRFLPYVSHMSVIKQPNNVFHVKGTAHSRIWGDWPFETTVRHEEQPPQKDYSYKAVWNEPGEELLVNRGSWTLSSPVRGQTLVVFALEIEVSKVPTFIVRNIIMDRLHRVLKALREEVQNPKA